MLQVQQVKALGVVGFVLALAMGCAPNDNKVLTQFDQRREDQKRQAQILSVDENRTDTVSVSAYALSRMLEVRDLLSWTQSARSRERCQVLHSFRPAADREIVELESNRCRSSFGPNEAEFDGVEVFDVQRTAQGQLASLDYRTLRSSWSLRRKRASAAITGTVSFEEVRQLQVYVAEGESDPSLYRFNYVVRHPRIEQELFESEYKMNEYEGQMEMVVRGTIWFAAGESLPVFDNIEVTWTRFGLRNLAKRERRGRFDSYQRQFSRPSTVVMKMRQFQENRQSPAAPVTFSGACLEPSADLFVEHDRRGTIYRDRLQAHGSSWWLVDGSQEVREFCRAGNRGTFSPALYDLIFFR